ncbi:MAG: hypothetical protein AUH78_14490 [Gemmatimonadetes bacterium 13_1_40CM_4_69_8]|nr:MAG: hypothetical protein AUH78_14490 [Gemmatimonadetes bacterium 13_1_40CM_4_69_8]
MSSASRLAAPVALCLGLVGRLAAQAAHDHHAEALGRVVFPVSCTPEARTRFEQAVALLHSFWYEKAADTFRDAVAVDSTCAMGYWGQAMSLFHQLWTPPVGAELAAGLAASERGFALARTPRERDYLTAIRTYYADYGGTDHKTRLVAYAHAMEGLRRRHPRDREASIFYALSLIALAQENATDTTFGYQKRADAILEPLFKVEPRHPGLAHYLIHTNDVPQLARLGLYAARRYAEIAPDAPHAQHMPSHIFTRLGLWDDAIASNTRSAAAARAFEDERHLNALWDQRGHAWDYMVYAYLQRGRDAEAKHVVDEAAAVTAVYPVGSLTNEYALAAIPARYALERGRWREAAALAVRPAPEWRAAEAITYFARALGSARSGDSAGARSAISALDDVERVEGAAGGAHSYWAGQVRTQRLAASAWLARAMGDTAGAVRLAASAADLEDVTQKHPVTPGGVLPARELLGDLLLELGRPSDAAKAYAASLAQQPNRARSLFGAARAAELAGDVTTARTRYRDYLALMEKSDGARAELEIARAGSQ